jgi:hypothetical protein
MMPIEIRELIIRATVTGGEAGGEEESEGGTDATDGSTIVAECVEQVLKVLERQKER